MNRRIFLKSAGIAGAGIVATPIALTLTGCTPNQINTAIADLPIAEGAVDAILSIVTTAFGLGYINSSALSIVNTVMAEVKVGLQAVAADLANYQKNPDQTILEQIDNALTAITSNLQNALSVAGITDPITLTTVLGLVALITGFVKLVQTVIPAAASASVVRKTAQARLVKPSTIPSPEEFKSLVNAYIVLSRPEYQDFQLK
jgi:hypothetical protein